MATTAKDCKPPKGKSANRIYEQNTRKPWWKQGYLMVGADQLIGPLRAKHSQSGYIKKLAMPKAQGTSLVNLLTTNKSLHSFFNGTSLDYSQLVPHIELFKVYIHNDASTKKDLEEHAFPFGAFSNFHDFHEAAIASGKLFRGREAGIQQVDIKMEGRGRNPVSANVLDITVKYFFNDVQTLFEPLGTLNDGETQMQFADLIRFPKSLRKTKRSFRVRLVLGWAMNPENPLKGDMPDGFVEAVRKSRVSIAADLYTHNMEFHEDGSLVLTAKYKGALEATFSGADILMAAVAANERDKTLDGLKKKIRELENSFAGSGFKGKSSGAEGSFRDILAIQRAMEELKKARLSIGARQDAKGTYPKVKDALDKLATAYNKYNKATGRQGKSQFEALQQATRTKGSLLERSAFERKNARKVAKVRKALEKRASQKALRKLRKEIRRVRKQIKEYENSIKGKHMFSYVEKLRDDCKLAWIPTGRGSNFGNYANLLDAVKKFGGSHDEKDQKKLKRAQKKVKKPGGGAVPSPGSETSGAPMLSHAAALLSTLYPRLAPSLEPLTPKEKAKDMLRPGGNKRGCSLKGRTQRQRTEHGDANLWETVGTPAYQKGEKMYFFRLGDLLTVILENGNFGKRLAEDAPNFKVLLGEYDIPRNDETATRMSLYDLPISLEIFHIFVAQKIVGTGRAVYPLLQFTFDLIKFIMDKTQGVFGKAAEFTQASLLPVSFKMDITSVDLPSEPLKKAGDTIQLRAFDDKTVPKTSLNTLQTTSIANTSNTFVLHAQRKIAAKGESIYNGNMAEDLERGIFHFFVGGPRRGVLKTINFTQAGNTLFSTALMRNGQAGGAQSSREGIIQPSKFVCELRLVGNPFFFIGQMFYVNTDLISGGHFWKEGILNGGYYIVTAVDNNFRADHRGSWETKIIGVLQIPDHVLAKNKDAAVDKLKDKSLAEQERLKKMADAKQKALIAAARHASDEEIRRSLPGSLMSDEDISLYRKSWQAKK